MREGDLQEVPGPQPIDEHAPWNDLYPAVQAPGGLFQGYDDRVLHGPVLLQRPEPSLVSIVGPFRSLDLERKLFVAEDEVLYFDKTPFMAKD